MRVNVKIKPHKKETVEINTDFIRLDSFLKLKGLAQTGGHAKMLIQDSNIKVNGEICTARGKKIKENDTVTFDNTDFLIINENKNN